VVAARVVSIGSDAVFVDLGGKAEGMLEIDQVTDPDTGKIMVALGDRVEARVVDLGGKAGCVLLRRTLGRGPDARDELVQAFEHRIPVEGVVTAVNKGGVEVQIAGTRAFCPVSQLDRSYVEDPAAYVGKHFTFRITKFEGSKARSNIVLSRRVLLEEEAASKAVELRARLREGLTVEGMVTSIKDYGAFVDLGGLEGMLHVSELGHSRLGHPSEVLRVGQKLVCQVIKIEKTGDPKRPERIALSLKALERDPWQDVAAQFAVGARVGGRVVRVEAYGAFVEIAQGVEGLVHVSELGAGRRISHAREVVKVGDRVQATVLAIDGERRRVSLSVGDATRADADAEERDNIARHSPSSPRSLGTFGDLLKRKLDP
jgi:small subunit ribosomal protein S1